uniref:Uncharacterized protein n=1 Tax=Globisporangium ultimum (strain ATCC 200006 / CBS 805.95 / DAOM BR144) TaxID=431595 RepID=K3XB79_GLOUD
MRGSILHRVALALSASVALCGSLFAAAQTERVVTETVSGTIYRYPTYISVDQYSLSIAAASAIVEFDILSVETMDNVTFTDVNNDCDSAYIDSQIYLFKKASDGSLQFLASNDDEGDDYSSYYGRGRRDGSLSTQDSYLIRKLSMGDYVLAVGRYPLNTASAAKGKSTEAIDQFTPYACQSRKASYGNYRMTVRSQSTAVAGIIKTYPNSYVGNSCSVSAYVTRECVFRLPGDYRKAIMN